MKTFRVHFKSKAGDQYVTLQARNAGEAEMLAGAHQARRADRFDITWARMDNALDSGAMTKDQYAAESERRKRDFDRYDIRTSKEVGKDEHGDPVFITETASAADPMKIMKVEEVK